jgi:hypothetical protein
MADGFPRPDRGCQLDRRAFAERAGVAPDSVTRGVRLGTYPQPDGVLGGRPWWWESTVDDWEPPKSGRPAGRGADETHAAGPRT